MASISARLTVIGENGYGEPEQDANSALTELDKGLRSGKIGEQSEAIVRFPRIFEKYPFPILINSAFLKLADVFRVGNNFLRLCILKVTQQSEKHLDKILNVDEFIRRIFAVIHSNDPIARALTLRTLGSVACIIPEWKNVHHSIRISLDSHDAVELDAAIYAVGRFAAHSKIFASNICNKVGQMIEGLATPVDMKLKLIAIFQHMHHDAQTAATVRKLCSELLPKYPGQGFVMVTLNTLTLLSAASLVSIAEQVQLLTDYLQADSRSSVKVLVLKNLKCLAEQGAHFWKVKDIEAVCIFASQTPYEGLKCGALDVLAALSRSVAVTKFNINADSMYLQLCNDCCYHSNVCISSRAIEFLTHLAIHTHRDDQEVVGVDLFQEASLAIESLLVAVIPEVTTVQITKALKLSLRCANMLSEAKEEMSSQFIDSIGTLIATSTGPTTALLCEALAAMGNKSAGTLFPFLPELSKRLQHMAATSGTSNQEVECVVIIFTLMFQALHNHPSDPEIEEVAKKVMGGLDLWMCYKIARQASRYGHHRIAAEIFSHLSYRVCSEHFHFWLVGLSEFCIGESCLQTRDVTVSHVDRISEATVHYMKGISSLKAATTPTNVLQFQCEYIRLRAEMLQAHAQLVRTCTSLKTSPPPAIAAAVATATRDELQRCGRITVQLRRCVREFRTLGDQYGRLYQSVFDADSVTLVNLQVLQQNCFLVAQAIDSIALRVQNLGIFEEEPLLEFSLGTIKQSQHTVETLGMLTASQAAAAVVASINQQGEPQKLIGHHHMQAVNAVSKILVETPLCFPRYFFQSLQSTSIKLAISPQPRAPGEPVNIQNNSHLALKVEGVIQHGARQGLFRKVRNIVLSISSVLQSRSQPVNDMKGGNETTNSMTQTVEPHNDYFNSQFLLAFPVAGLHMITVDVSVVDDGEDVWKTGPRSTLTIKSFDDLSNQKVGTSGSRPVFQNR